LPRRTWRNGRSRNEYESIRHVVARGDGGHARRSGRVCTAGAAPAINLHDGGSLPAARSGRLSVDLRDAVNLRGAGHLCAARLPGGGGADLCDGAPALSAAGSGSGALSAARAGCLPLDLRDAVNLSGAEHVRAAGLPDCRGADLRGAAAALPAGDADGGGATASAAVL
jgi:hypothetical protein